MASVDTFKMKDGRKVTVNWLSLKSIMKVRKKDWKEIRKIIEEQLDYVNSPKYIEDLKNHPFLSWIKNTEWSSDGKCVTIYK